MRMFLKKRDWKKPNYNNMNCNMEVKAKLFQKHTLFRMGTLYNVINSYELKHCAAQTLGIYSKIL